MSSFLLPNGMLDFFDIVKVEGGSALLPRGTGLGYTGAGAQYAARRPLCFWYQGTAAPQYEEGLLRTGIFGILERSRKIPAVASWLGDPARGRSK